MKPKLYYAGIPEDGFGWGVCNTNLTRALAEYCEVIVDGTSARFNGPVVMPISDSNLNPLRKVSAPRVIGYCFTEWPLGHNVKRAARQYDVIFAGSEWNASRLRAAGVPASVLHQGIDHERFSPQSPSERKGFVVFSGGKYEFRKGQDYVIAAMRRFMEVYGDVVLLAAWHNPWPQSMASMRNSWLLEDVNDPLKGLPSDRVILLPPMPNEKTPAIYAQAHIGLFPNRCEAGTNLVMCEFMACERPVIATKATGHADVFPLSPLDPWLLDHGTYDAAGWFNCEVSDIIAQLNHAYQHRDELPALGQAARKLVERFTWDAAARQVFQAAFPGRALPVSDHEIAPPPAA